MELDPNLAWGHMFLAPNLGYLGEPQAALEHARVALRLSPEDPQMFGIQSAHAQAHLFLGQLDEALTWSKAAVRQRSNFLIGQCMVAITAALTGRNDEAARALARVREIDPRASLASLAQVLPLRRAQDREIFADGLRRAGLRD